MLTTNDFTYNSEQKTLSAEASTLRGRHLAIASSFHKEGSSIFVKSSNTGKVVEFEYVGPEWDQSHEDILGWHYAPPIELSDKVVRLVIFND